MDRVTVARYETGALMPSLPRALQIARVLGATVEELWQLPGGQHQRQSTRRRKPWPAAVDGRGLVQWLLHTLAGHGGPESPLNRLSQEMISWLDA